MIVKSFEGKTISEAIKKVKKELGSDATIIDTKEVGNNESKIVQVKAAADVSKSKRSGATLDRSENTPHALYGQIINEITATKKQVSEIRLNQINEHRFSALENHVKDLKLLFTETSNTKGDELISKLPTYLKSIYEKLLLMDIEKNYLFSLLKYLKQLPVANPIPNSFKDLNEFYESHAIQWFIRNFTISKGLTYVKGQHSIHLFMGAHGCGKTSTIIKIASQLKKKGQNNVTLISLENSSLSQFDKLRVYSKIINIPYHYVSSALELKEIIAKYHNSNVLLIDTAGESSSSEHIVAQIKEASDLQIPIETHLVLPLTEKRRQLEQVLRCFSPVGINHLLFTKLDEALTYGDIFNLSHKWSLPLSYFSTGAKIPNNIEKSSKERLIERIFKIS